MKKQYTKKQIQEAINYWQKRLNESITIDDVRKTYYILFNQIKELDNNGQLTDYDTDTIYQALQMLDQTL